jgi:hypothetical protein
MNTPFWSTDPQILWNSQYLTEIWPTTTMSLQSKLNAVSRLIIYLSLFGYLTTFNFLYIFSGILTLLVIYFIYIFRNSPLLKKSLEGFLSNSKNSWNPIVKTENGKSAPLPKFLDKTFYHSNSKNPFGNVLLTEISDDPLRKSAPPAFNPDVYEDITSNTMKMVQNQNEGIKNTNKKLFGDLWDKFELDLCLRNFYSTPNTKVPNDQGAYADYLYGSMPSCKDGNAFQCSKDNLRYILI